MAQPRRMPIRYEGPFLGLATTPDPRQLGPAYAVLAHNVILTDGRIAPRAPWLAFKRPAAMENKRVISLLHWVSNKPGEPPFVIAKVVRKPTEDEPDPPGELWKVSGDPNADADLSVQLDTGPGKLSALPAQFISVGKFVYVLDGSSRLVKIRTDDAGMSGITVYAVGIAKPVVDTTVMSNYYDIPVGEWPVGDGYVFFPYNTKVTADEGGMSGRFSYQVTYYDADNNVESNPLGNTYWGEVREYLADATHRPYVVLGRCSSPVILHREHITHVRIYRRNVSFGQVFHRLVAHIPMYEVGFNYEWVDEFETEEDISLSNTEVDPTSDTIVGPFAPSRNGLPPKATAGAWYKDRMFYNDPDDVGLVRYSGMGHPDAVAADDFINVRGGDTDEITGLADFAGRLVIGERRSIHILTGTIRGADNNTAALGLTPPQSAHVVAKTEATVGPLGGGFVVAGSAPVIFYASEAGFMAFDGMNSQSVSVLIKPTWSDFLKRGSAGFNDSHFSFAVDSTAGVIYMCNGRRAPLAGPDVLAYHYALAAPAWSTHGTGFKPDQPTDITAVAASKGFSPRDDAGEVDEAWAYSPLIMGSLSGVVSMAVAEPFPSGADFTFYLADVKWTYQTGAMPLIRDFAAHIFFVKWYYARVKRWYGPTPRAQFSYILNQEDESPSVEDKVTQDLTQGVRRIHKIGRSAEDIALIARAVEFLFWAPDAGITGFDIDFEPEGH